ncbi:hypothetical protein B0T22DRAFT_112514 [Podospora appendiculata]|uniref:Uncharacterized protein n=1 Tax=Podospora appendiculata TaxID=314037 RepID=A0AAE1CIB6_9PEZI|nr:hypothetical protein B0T22DRAFT_112514 [Podospora appendiculata]
MKGRRWRLAVHGVQLCICVVVFPFACLFGFLFRDKSDGRGGRQAGRQAGHGMELNDDWQACRLAMRRVVYTYLVSFFLVYDGSVRFGLVWFGMAGFLNLFFFWFQVW